MEQTDKAVAYTSKVRDRILNSTYQNPEQSITQLNEALRAEKVVNEHQTKKLRETYSYMNPGASREKADAGAFRMTYEKKLKERQKEFAKKLEEEQNNVNFEREGKKLKIAWSKKYFF